LLRAGQLMAGMLLVLSLAGAPGVVSAEAAPQPSAEYDAAVKLGFEEFTLGNYVEARARFGEAHKLHPNARTLRALGMVEYELKRYVEAIEYLRQALASDERPLTSELRAQTERLSTQAGGYVTRYRFALTPADATLTIDGAPVRAEASRGVLLAAGEHVIEASAENHQATRRTLQVLGGEEDHSLAIILLAERVESGGQATTQDQPKSSRAKKAWIWGTIGAVVVAGAVVGLVLGLRKDADGEQVNKGTTGIDIRVPRGMALERR
jgi:tetratricopeptide (TPR) repeat protein